MSFAECHASCPVGKPLSLLPDNLPIFMPTMFLISCVRPRFGRPLPLLPLLFFPSHCDVFHGQNFWGVTQFSSMLISWYVHFFFSWSTLFEEFFWHHECLVINAVVISHCFLVCRGRNFLLVFFHKLSRLIFFVKAAKPFVFSCHIHSYAPFTIHIASVSCDCFLYYKFSSL